MNEIFITAQDRQRLKDCLARLQEYPDRRDLPHIRQLEREIDRAVIILDPMEVPRDVVTMRTSIQLRDLDTGTESRYTLVYPSESAPGQNRVSVLAPIGAALLGCRVGDVVEWEVPKGTCRFKVEEILYQPEAAGEYGL